MQVIEKDNLHRSDTLSARRLIFLPSHCYCSSLKAKPFNPQQVWRKVVKRKVEVPTLPSHHMVIKAALKAWRKSNSPTIRWLEVRSFSKTSRATEQLRLVTHYLDVDIGYKFCQRVTSTQWPQPRSQWELRG